MSPILKGVIITVAIIAFAVITALMGIEKSKSLGWIQYVLIIGGIIWACVSFSSQMESNVTFGNVFAHGFKVTAVVTSLFIVYMALALTFIFPEVKDQAINVMRTEMAKQPNYNEAQADKIVGITQKYFVLFTAGGTLVLFLILGAIASLIGAVVAKKNPNANPLG